MKANASQAIEFAKLQMVSRFIARDAQRKYDETMSSLRPDGALQASRDRDAELIEEMEH